MDDFIKQALAERARLSDLLEQNPVFQKYQAVTKVLEAYNFPTEIKRSESHAEKKSFQQAGSKSFQIIEAAREYLVSKGPAPTAEILGYLKSKNIEVGGKNEVGNLSAYMSNAGLFNNDRQRGWTLKSASQLEADALLNGSANKKEPEVAGATTSSLDVFN